MFTSTAVMLGLSLRGAIPIGGITITVPTVTAAGIGGITIGADLTTDGIRGGVIPTTDGTHGVGTHPTTGIIIGDIPTATTTIPIITIGDGVGTTAQTGVSLTRTTTAGEAIRVVVRDSHLRYAPTPTRPEYRVAAQMLQYPHEVSA